MSLGISFGTMKNRKVIRSRDVFNENTIYKDKVEEQQCKKGFIEFDNVFKGEVPREDNGMLEEN